MAVRLGDRVVRGEIFNTSHYTVHGWIELRGRKHPVHLSLTGDCGPDLKGRHLRFEARGVDDAGEQAEEADPDRASDLEYLAVQQVGPTGIMTAARQVKVADCPTGELLRRIELGEPPPLAWKRCLYLEWFSQNGRVVVEMPDPVIEFVEKEDEADSDEEMEGHLEDLAPHAGPDEAGAGEDVGPLGDGAWEDADEEPEDAFGLMPDGLQEQLDAQTSEIDRAVRGDDDSDVIDELELMDDLIENGPGIELVHIFDGPIKLPRPEQIESDEEAEASLKTVLAQLALYGIALDVCEHFTPRETYRLLVEDICPGETAYPELRGTGWVQHFSTSDFCAKCEAQFEREYEERERKRKESGEADGGAADDGLPF